MATFLGNRAKLLASAQPAVAVTPLLTGDNGGGPPDGSVAYGTYIQDTDLLGVKVGRSYLSANLINPSNGSFTFTYRQGGPDLWVNSLLAANRYVILQDVFSPDFYYQGSPTRSAAPYSISDSPIYSATAGSDWDYWVSKRVAFLTRCAQQYTDPKMIWELGNEMNVPGIYWRYNFSASTAPTPQAYADYFLRCRAAIKAVNPSQKVIIGGLLRVDSALSGLSGIAFMQQLQPYLAAAGVVPDGVSLHPYMLGAPNADPTIDRGANVIGITSWDSVRRFLAALNALGLAIPVYITETGFRASQSNAQGAFNTNSEATKAVWNRYEPDSTYYLYSKAAVGAGKSWVEAIMYYRYQEYPSPTNPTYAAAISADPPEGPHTLTAWGTSLIDFTTRLKNRQRIPLLQGMTLTGVPSTVVIGASPATISAAGTNIPCVATFLSSDPTVVSVTTPTTGSSTTTIQFLSAGKATIKAQSKAANGMWISAVQTVDVQAAVATSATLSPASGWKVATSNGGTIQFVATVRDQIGNPMAASGTWTSSDPTNAPISSTGLLTAIGVVTGVTVTFTPDTGTAPGRIATSTGDVVLNPVLQITNAPSELLNYGAVALSVTDGASPVTGFTINISDPTKATASGADLIGKGGSGTFNLTVSKSGLTTSSISVVTCTGGAIFDDKDAIGQANGTSVSSYTDPDGISWALLTAAPTYATNVINGHNALTFNGTNQSLKAAVTHPRLNSASVTYMALLQPSNAAPSANEQILDIRDQPNSEGFVLGRNASSPNVGASVLTYYTAPGTTKQQFDGTKMPSGAFYRDSVRIRSGKQERMINGVVQTTVGSDAVYRYPQTSPTRPTKAVGNLGGNYYAGYLACETIVNRAVTDAEWAQMDYYQQVYATAAGINPATLDHLTLLISSTTATVGSTVPTLTVQKWADAAETTPSTASVTLGYTSGTPATATVNSSTGVITPVAAGTTAFTVTDSISGKSTTSPTLTVSAAPASYDSNTFTAGTGAGIFGTSGAAPVKWDAAKNYASDRTTAPNFRANCSVTDVYNDPTKAGTGGGGSLYNDGLKIDLMTWQNSVVYSGDPTWEYQIVGLTTYGGSAPTPIIRSPLTANAGWAINRMRYVPGFTTLGDATPGSDGATFNLTESTGWKKGMFVGYVGEGRAALTMNDVRFLVENGPKVGATNYGLINSATGASTANEWTDGNWYDYATYFEQFIGQNGTTYYGATTWMRKIGDAHYTRLGGRRVAATPLTTLRSLQSVTAGCENYNQARTTSLYFHLWGWSFFDDSTNPDPLGILAYEATLTPQTPTISNVVSQTGSSATFTVGIGQYAGSVTPVVDGTPITAQTYTLPLEIPEVDPSTNGTSSIGVNPISRTITGLSAGSHTISFNVTNRAGTISVNTGNKSVTI
jgi:hypothetical protein